MENTMAMRIPLTMRSSTVGNVAAKGYPMIRLSRYITSVLSAVTSSAVAVVIHISCRRHRSKP